MTKLRQQKLFFGSLAAGALVLAGGQALLWNSASAQKALVEAPIFEVDPLWP